MSNSQDQFLDTAQAAHYLGYAKSTLDWWRTDSRGPDYHKMAGRVRYRQSDLDAFMDAGLVKTRG